MAFLRILLGILGGLALGFGLVMVGDLLNMRFFPPPPEVQVTNPEALRDYMQSAPITALLGLPVTWIVATFAGAFASAKIAGRAWPGWLVGALLFAATALNLALIPHPLWMLLAAIVLVPAAAFFAPRLAAPAAG